MIQGGGAINGNGLPAGIGDHDEVLGGVRHAEGPRRVVPVSAGRIGPAIELRGAGEAPVWLREFRDRLRIFGT